MRRSNTSAFLRQLFSRPAYRKPRNPFIIHINRVSGRNLPIILAVSIVFALIAICSGIYLRTLTREYAQTVSLDQIQQTIAAIISDKMSDVNYDYFVTLDKDSSGSITALTTNTARINALSSEIISDIAEASTDGRLDLRIPLGSLTGSALLSGRGPVLPVRVILLTSSTANFTGELVSAGINQTKHRIMLNLSVNLNILIPWDSLRQTVNAELLVAETVIVGRVPDSYINLN